MFVEKIYKKPINNIPFFILSGNKCTVNYVKTFRHFSQKSEKGGGHIFCAVSVFFLKFQIFSIDMFYLSTDIIFSTIELPTSYTILESLSCT